MEIIEGKPSKLRAGDYVHVRQLNEILDTLNEKGCLDDLPFMPEMAEYCGQRFRVLYRVEKTCLATTGRMAVREFINNDVVFLDGIRCSGIDHDGCQRACMVFWKERWLDPVRAHALKPRPSNTKGMCTHPGANLRVRQDSGRYFCQSTELIDATRSLSKSAKIRKVFDDISSRTYTIPKSIKLVCLPVFRKLYRKLYDPQPVGGLQRTPDESLGLQPGDLVEVRGLRDIKATLDAHGRNRGLEFSPDMKAYCGKRFRVHSRLDRMIIEQNGEMKEVKNTVILKGITCGCFYAFGGCPRKEFQLWREIWLRKVD